MSWLTDLGQRKQVEMVNLFRSALEPRQTQDSYDLFTRPEQVIIGFEQEISDGTHTF